MSDIDTKRKWAAELCGLVQDKGEVSGEDFELYRWPDGSLEPRKNWRPHEDGDQMLMIVIAMRENGWGFAISCYEDKTIGHHCSFLHWKRRTHSQADDICMPAAVLRAAYEACHG